MIMKGKCSSKTDLISAIPVLLYIPNIIDYVRIVMLVTSWIFHHSSPWISLSTYATSMILDAVDGIAARRLNQTSSFGAWLDVVVDNVGRGMLWCRLYEFGFCITALEWLTFVCTHAYGSEWKSKIVGPWLVQLVMINNFRSPVGLLAIGSLNVLPIWLYCLCFDLLSDIHLPTVVQYLVLGVLIAGRIVCALVEIWTVFTHILFLCLETKDSSGGLPHGSKGS